MKMCDTENCVQWRTGTEVRLDNISVLNQIAHHEDVYGGLDPRFLYLGVIKSQPVPTEQWATEQPPCCCNLQHTHGWTYLLQIRRELA